MRDHNVVFDHENHRIGFAEGICDYRPEVLDLDKGRGRNTAPVGFQSRIGIFCWCSIWSLEP